MKTYPLESISLREAEEKQFRIVSNCVQAIARDCLAVNWSGII